MKISRETKKIFVLALKASSVFVLIAICLAFCSLQAEASRGDDEYLSRYREIFEKETRILQKEGTMDALEIGDEEGTDERVGKVAANRSDTLPDKLMHPKNTAKSAPAESQAGQGQAANTAGDIAKDMACMAIDYASRFMKNFTTQDGNRWNNYRNQIFVPMALLLILPGALMTQVRAIMAQGNPVIGGASPFEGIQRGLIAIFLVPASCLVTNYAIDLGNSLHHSVCSEYTRIVGGDMYRDAMCAEIRAFGVRYLSENEGSLRDMAPDLSPRGNEPFAEIEGRIWGKISDPCTGLLLVPPNRDDTVMPQATLATRLGMFTANAGICAGWAMLTAFQMAFFYYLYFAGPIMAALWAWPTQLFKNAFPTWVESCVTLAFWSFLWQVTIALLAMTKSPASSGLYMVTALNVLATTSVKHAFDCAAIMKSAVQSCEQIGAEVAQNAGSGGGGGSKGGGKGGKKGGAKGASSRPAAAPDRVAASRKGAPVRVAALGETPVITYDDEGNELNSVPAILTPSREVRTPDSVPVETTLPPAARIAANSTPDPSTVWAREETALAASTVTAFAPEAEPESESFTTTLNATTGTWNDPVAVGAPPSAGAASLPARNTISSVLGNAIQEIMVYPANVPYQDPDLIYLEKIKAEIEKQQELEKQQENQSQIETHSKVETQNQSVNQTENFSPDKNLYSTPEQETDMNSNDDPRIAALRDQRFNYPPPPMVDGQQAAGFTKIPSGAALTPHQLLSKLQAVVEPTTTFSPPPPTVGTQVPAQVPAVPAYAFTRAEGNDTNFDVQEEAVVTVADFTSDLQGQSAHQPRQANLNEALSQVLRQRDAWVQSQSQVKPPVPQTLSTSWWS